MKRRRSAQREKEQQLGLAAPRCTNASRPQLNDVPPPFVPSWARQANGKTVVGYGAAAKGNTLLNHCGVSTREIAYVVDRRTRTNKVTSCPARTFPCSPLRTSSPIDLTT